MIINKGLLKSLLVSLLGLLLMLSAATVSQSSKSSNDQNRRRARRNDDYPNLGGSAELRRTALNAGYNEGVKAGRHDHERGEPSDFADETVYQEAETGYTASLGDKQLYQRYFRMAFENGYDAGYNGY